MEDTYTHHSTGYTCTVCGGVAIAEIAGSYLCGGHAIDAMTVTSACENRNSPSKCEELRAPQAGPPPRVGDTRSAASIPTGIKKR